MSPNAASSAQPVAETGGSTATALPAASWSADPFSPPGSTIAQQREEEWSAGKAGMWDSLVDLAQVFFPPPYREYGRLPSPTTLLSSLDWAKAGPPGPTGDPARDAELLENYQRGGWVTKTISVAAPIGAEGLLTSASTAATKLPALEGMGIGGGRLIGPTEQWLSGFTEIPESLGPELPTLGPELGNSLQAAEETFESSVSQWRTREVEDLLQRAKEAGLRVSANGPESWTPRQIEAAIEYQEVYNQTLSPQRAGTAAHDVLGAPTSGADGMYFVFVHEIKTSIGAPDVSVFVDAMEQAQSYGPGQPAVVTVFDMLNGVKYFVQRGP
jgi:hypothetical protein